MIVELIYFVRYGKYTFMDFTPQEFPILPEIMSQFTEPAFRLTSGACAVDQDEGRVGR